MYQLCVILGKLACQTSAGEGISHFFLSEVQALKLLALIKSGPRWEGEEVDCFLDSILFCTPPHPAVAQLTRGLSGLPTL